LGAPGRGRRAELACLLYTLFDHELATKDTYHITLTALAERYGMTHQRYKSDRKRPFAHAARLLDGQPILGEKYRLQVQLRDAADGKDYVLVARRQPSQLELFKGR
jgi:hypothetical protein